MQQRSAASGSDEEDEPLLDRRGRHVAQVSRARSWITLPPRPPLESPAHRVASPEMAHTQHCPCHESAATAFAEPSGNVTPAPGCRPAQGSSPGVSAGAATIQKHHRRRQRRRLSLRVGRRCAPPWQPGGAACRWLRSSSVRASVRDWRLSGSAADAGNSMAEPDAISRLEAVGL
jgi:hypothetical protein